MLMAEVLNPETISSLFFYCALFGGVILLLQLAMMFIGFDDGGLGELGDGLDLGGGDFGDGLDGDASTDASGFWLLEIISIRTLSAAATFFGLVGMASLTGGQSTGVSLAFACVAGYAAMYSVYWVFKQIFKLETSGNEDIRNAVGIVGKVYIPIDPGAKGKIQLKLQGRTVEYQAISDHAERLATGVNVMITEIISNDTVKVAARN